MKFGITVGIPLCGKSTFCENKRKEGWVIVNPDTFRKVYSNSERTLLDNKSEEVVWQCVYICVRSLLRTGHDVLLDATNVNKWRRESWVNVAKDFGVKLQIFVMPFDVEKSVKRNREIGRFVDSYGTPTDSVIMKMAKNYNPPEPSEGEIIEVT
jgi:predicted kinase